jgi:hypothetical protein
MYVVSVSDPERYFLRLILLRVKGATGFKDLRTVNGVYYNTFRETAEALHLLADDTEWEMALEEAAVFKMPYQLRCLFAYICIFCLPKNAAKLWETFKEELTEDLIKIHPTDFEAIAMVDIQEILRLHGKSFKDFDLPKPSKSISYILYDCAKEKEKGKQFYQKLNEAQKHVFSLIKQAIESPKESNCFFIDGPGGSGKTFLYNTLMHVLRGMSKIVIPVASTGIAANLLRGGRTYHSTFKLGINIKENTVSNITQNSSDCDFENCIAYNLG